MIRRLLTPVLSAVLVFSIILTGCTPGGGDTLPPPGSGGRLNLAATEPYNLDPALVGDAGGLTFVSQIFTGLVKVTATGVEPDIAAGWVISNDGTVYTFTLRQDVLFQDGTPVTAADFKYSWERALTPATGSTTARTYLGDILGAEAMLAGESSSLAGVRVIDDYTLEITIDTARSYFLSKLTYATAFVVDAANVAEGGEWWRSPNGTGPFKMDQWATDAYIMLKKNESYYGGVPSLDSVVFKFLAGRAMDLYELGEVDVAGVDLAYIDRALDPAGVFAADAQVISQLSLYFLGFNSAEAPFDDPLIRQAFSLALNRNQLMALVFNNMNQAAEGIVPPGIPGYDPDKTGIGFDPELARELIARSSYGSVANLPEITLTTLGYGGLIGSDLEAVIHQWQVNLGVEVKVRQLEPEVFLYNLKQEKDQIFYQGWIADYPHPQNFLEILFQTGADNNWGGYSNPLVDQLLAQAAMLTDEAASEALYRQVEEILVADAAVWPYYFGRSYLLVKPYVKGYELSPLGVPVLQNVSVDRAVEAPTGLTVS
ncbi:MAG: peptide ABC transporter substrate-binding protein [Dehalogenimonas sp.]|uniref:Peptide ABC transporter substrate-binding protein n=1 Tax=Candidatus Dehalogenimonas loeffleri TaxID=3127115 RepID=A0ABZ2J771_9CHLR|nr:peptide ABC transporter substrate-binding protein [Dehalogenimonas sp.]